MVATMDKTAPAPMRSKCEVARADAEQDLWTKFLGNVANLVGGQRALITRGAVEVGDIEYVQTKEGKRALVKVLATDTISRPPRARVQREDTHEVFVVPVLHPEEAAEMGCAEVEDTMFDSRTSTIYQDYDDSFALASQAASSKQLSSVDEFTQENPILEGLRNELLNTLEDLKDKGPVLTVGDAVCDACDLVGSAVEQAASNTSKLLRSASKLLSESTIQK